MLKNVIVILGPTCSGKSTLASELALKIGGHIINADSRQLYQHVQYGTAQPSLDSKSVIPHHLYGFLFPRLSYDVGQYICVARRKIQNIFSINKVPIVVGGTGFYIKSLFNGLSILPKGNQKIRDKWLNLKKERGAAWVHEHLNEIDPDSANRISQFNTHAVIRAIEVYEVFGIPISSMYRKFPPKKFDVNVKFYGIHLHRNELRYRILQRTMEIVDKIVQETKTLLRLKIPLYSTVFKSIGYRECLGYLKQKYSYDTFINKVFISTCQYAKRQLTWFKKDQKILWHDIHSFRKFISSCCALSSDG